MVKTFQNHRRDMVISLVLAVVTLLPYAQLYRADFINMDDPGVVSCNPMVTGGLTWRGVQWAFTTSHLGNWLPVTWLSHMLDCQLFGPTAGPHHMVNVALHIATSVLLYWWLKRMTRAPWRCAFVAGLFALHPLHVESVAWISERKDVLCGLFWMLTLLAYARYTERPGTGRYLSVLLWFTLGLMSKPMIVTLPFVLMLLDYWPLRRKQAYVEKIPFFALAAVACIIAVWAQHAGGAVAPLGRLPLTVRLQQAVLSYGAYVGKLFWPANLMVFYPHPRSWLGGQIPAGQVAGNACWLLATTALALWLARRRLYAPVGWFWYVGTLLPVIGLVQVGTQAMADRYTYIPSVGLFIVGAWATADVANAFPKLRSAAAVAGVMVLIALGARTWQRVGDWHDHASLFSAMLRVMPNNYFAHGSYAHYLQQQGRLPEAVEHFAAAARYAPGRADIRRDLARALVRTNRLREATQEYREAIRLDPNHVPTLNDCAWLLATHTDPVVRNGSEALLLAQSSNRLTGGNDPIVLDTLAAAYAEASQLENALHTAERAHQLAMESGNKQLAAAILNHIEKFRQGQPWREGDTPSGGNQD